MIDKYSFKDYPREIKMAFILNVWCEFGNSTGKWDKYEITVVY